MTPTSRTCLSGPGRGTASLVRRRCPTECTRSACRRSAGGPTCSSAGSARPPTPRTASSGTGRRRRPSPPWRAYAGTTRPFRRGTRSCTCNRTTRCAAQAGARHPRAGPAAVGGPGRPPGRHTRPVAVDQLGRRGGVGRPAHRHCAERGVPAIRGPAAPPASPPGGHLASRPPVGSQVLDFVGRRAAAAGKTVARGGRVRAPPPPGTSVRRSAWRRRTGRRAGTSRSSWTPRRAQVAVLTQNAAWARTIADVN
jgi:hypothetical protein